MTDAMPAPRRLHPRPTQVEQLYSSPYVDSYERRASLWERAVARQAERDVRRRFEELPRRPLRVLDLGAGNGRTLHRLHRAGVDVASYLGVDSSPRMITAARDRYPYSRARFDVGDVTDVDSIEPHDLVIATWVLSHLGDPGEALDRWLRLLAPRGRLVVACLTDGPDHTGRLVRWRLEHQLHCTPVDPQVLVARGPRHVHRSLAGSCAVVEYRRGGDG